MSTAKLIGMSLFTAGLYDLYWVYRSWKQVAVATGVPKQPVLKVLVAPISLFQLAGRANDLASHAGYKRAAYGAVLPAAYFLLRLLQFEPGIVGLAGYASVGVLAVLQSSVAFGNELRGHARYSESLRVRDVVALVLLSPVTASMFIETWAPGSLS